MEQGGLLTSRGGGANADTLSFCEPNSREGMLRGAARSSKNSSTAISCRWLAVLK